MVAMRLLAACLVLAAGGATVLAAEYYVAPDGDDANPGTLEKPFKDPVRAAARLGPGDTLFFRAGLYKCRTNGTIGLAPSRDGQPGKPITFKNYNNEHVQIDCTGSDWGFTPNGYSYIVIDGFDITNKTHYGMKISAASSRKGPDGGHAYSRHVTVRNCEVHHTNGECIFSYGTEHLTVENCHLHDSAYSHGLYLQSGCHHAVVRNVTSENNQGNSGMQLNAAGPKDENFITNARVENNLLRGNAQGFSLMAVRDSVFRGNVVFNNCYEGSRGTGGREVICWTYGDAKAGKPGNPCRNILFENNTIVNLRPGKQVYHLFQVKDKSAGIVLRNNILLIGADRPLMTVAADSTEGLVLAGNLWLTPSAFQVALDKQNLTLDEFTKGRAGSTGNVKGDPKLADPDKGDFAPQPGSPAIGAAVPSTQPEMAAKFKDIGAVQTGLTKQRIGCDLPWKRPAVPGEPPKER